MSFYLQITHKEIDASRNEAPLPRSQKHQPTPWRQLMKKSQTALSRELTKNTRNTRSPWCCQLLRLSRIPQGKSDCFQLFSTA
uniref:Uncharacterized protein n=1 Tax=Mustela putorius furo TaxID=9669 RepID=M3YJR4_MUSPF